MTNRRSGEQFIEANGIEICYETFGNALNPAIILIMGLGSQMIYWPIPFCEKLAENGFWVIRFDNRDVGRSTKFDHAQPPSATALTANLLWKKPVATPYQLDDMADDTVGLLDALGIERAHIVGLSMGGMIAQLVALNYPTRVLTLTSIMSTTSERDLPWPSMQALTMLLKKRPSAREAYIESGLTISKQLSGSRYKTDESVMRALAELAFDRCFYPAGTGRQLGAVAATSGRRKRLRQLNIPTLVVHGDEDPLVPISSGRDTASAIPNADLMVIEGMGHTFPPQVWDRFIERFLAQHKSILEIA